MRLTCIICPLGCSIEVNVENDKIVDVSGHGCPRGIKFAETEVYNPQRMLTTIMMLDGGEYPFLPVISQEEVPKEKLRDCLSLLKKNKVKAPIKMGDIIEENILGTGVNIIAAKTAGIGER